MAGYQNISLQKHDRARNILTEHDEFLVALRHRLQTGARKKIGIYRPGQAPAGAQQGEEDEGDDDADEKLQAEAWEHAKQRHARQRVEAQIVFAGEGVKHESGDAATARPKFKAEIVDSMTFVKAEPDDDTNRITADDLKKLQVQDIKAEGEESEEDEEEDIVARRRAKARARALAEEAKERDALDADLPEEKADDAQDEGESSEYETDSEDDTQTFRPLLKPQFVSRKDRETLEQRKLIEEEELALEEEKKKRQKERKAESRQLVVEEIKREEAEKEMAVDEEEKLPPDDDNVNDELELQRWKLRELKRLKRDKEERLKWDKEQAEVERRRNMTDAQIAADNARNPKPEKIKGQMRFLQKYYHKGSYYQAEDEDVFHRDFAAPTGEDKTVDRTLLPQVLQVKKFGMKGRTKYTHLMDQDTLQLDKNPWARSSELKRHQPAGMGTVHRPSAKKPKV